MDKSGWDSAIAAVGGDTKKLAENIGGFGKKLSVAVTAPIMGMAALGVKSFIDLDAAMTQSTAIMGNLSAETKKSMADVAKAMSRETAFSAAELAKGYYYLASAGLSVEQQMKALPVVAKFAQAGMFDLSTATEMLSDSVSALGLKSSEATKQQAALARVSDVLVKANVLSNATTQQLAESLTNKAAAALRFVNKEVEEGVAVLSAYADQGLKGASAGEALNIVLRDLKRAANENAGEWKKAGVAVYDSSGEMRHMADIVQDLDGYLSTMSTQQKQVALTTLGMQDRSQAYTIALLGTSDRIREYEAALKKAGGTTEEISKKQMEALGIQIKQTGKALASMAREIVTGAIPIIRALAKGVKEAAEFVAGLPPPLKNIILVVGGLAASIGPLLIAVAAVIRAKTEWLKVSTVIRPALKNLGGEITGLGSLLKGLPLVAGAAFVGWNIGRLISDVTGLTAAVRKVNWEFEGMAPKGVSAMIELDGVVKKLRASTGDQSITVNSLKREYGSFEAALAAVKEKYADQIAALEKTGKASEETGKKVAGLAVVTDEMKAKQEEYVSFLNSVGIYTEAQQAEMTEKVMKAKADLAAQFAANKISAEVYHSALAQLNDKLKEYNLSSALAAGTTRDTGEVLRRAADGMNLAAAVGGKVSVAFKDEATWGAQLNTVIGGLGGKTIPQMRVELRELLRQQSLVTMAWKAGALAPEEYKRLMDDLQARIRGVGSATDETRRETETATRAMSNAWEEFYIDIGRGIADVFVKQFGIQKALIGEATKHNEEYFKGALEDLKEDYENRKAYIEENVKDEDERKKQLLALDEWYAAETDRIRADEEKSREEHAKSEEARQNSLWTKVKTIFASAVESMMTKYLTDFIGGLLTHAPKAVKAISDVGGAVSGLTGTVSQAAGGIQGVVGGLASGIGGIISSLATGIGTGIAAIATGISTAIVTLATGIAAAATTLAAAAPALLTVGAIALAIYAGFAAINALLSSASGGAGDGMGRVVERQDRFLAGWDWWHRDVVDILAYIQGRMDVVVDKLDYQSSIFESIAGGNGQSDALWRIVDNTAGIWKAIEGLPGAQQGAVFTRPTLAFVHGTPQKPEIALPADRLAAVIESGGGRGGQTVLAPVFQIYALDGESVRRVTREKIYPELVSLLRSPAGREALVASIGGGA